MVSAIIAPCGVSAAEFFIEDREELAFGGGIEVWADLGEGRDDAQIVDALAHEGVLVRAGGALGKAGSVRVTGGTPPEVYYYTDDHYRSFRSFEVSR